MKEYIVQAIAQETIDSFDAHNAPELIRCKNCAHNGKVEKCVLAAIAAKKGFPLFMLDNCGEWFCADGERGLSDAIPGESYQGITGRLRKR